MTGEYRNCPSKNFHLAVPKKAVGEAFSLSFVSRIEKKCFRGLIHDFLSNFFLSHSAGNFCRGTLYSSINLSYRKTLCFKGLCKDFLSKIFRLKVPKQFVAERGSPLCCVSENFW